MEFMLRRRRLEDRILALAGRVDTSRPEGRWLDDERFWDFIYAWHDLKRHYEHSDDTTLSAELLRLYLGYAALLRELRENPRVALHRQERATSALMELNYQVDGVIQQIERNARGFSAAAGAAGETPTNDPLYN
ncbi:MAG: hypothetical protein SNJ59_14865 [Aggregatilineales bacterium]